MLTSCYQYCLNWRFFLLFSHQRVFPPLSIGVVSALVLKLKSASCSLVIVLLEDRFFIKTMRLSADLSSAGSWFHIFAPTWSKALQPIAVHFLGHTSFLESDYLVPVPKWKTHWNIRKKDNNALNVKTLDHQHRLELDGSW